MKAIKLWDTRNRDPEVKSRINEFMREQYNDLWDEKASEYFNKHPEFRKLLHTARKGKLYAKDAIKSLDNMDPERKVEMWIKEKLAKFKEVVQGKEQIVYDFVDFLSTYMNDELVPAGFNLWAALALYDIQNKKNWYTWAPITHPITKYSLEEINNLQLRIPEIAGAIFDENFSKTVRKIHTEVNEQVKVQKDLNNVFKMMWWTWFERKKIEEEDKNVEMTDEKLVEVIHKIRGLVNELSKKNGNSTDDRIKEWVNPFYNQTEKWLFIEMYYGSPHYLRTPRWKVQIPFVSRSDERDKIKEDFFSKMKIEEYIKETNSEMWVYGPVYALLNFDGVDLPKPKERNKKDYISYEDANAKREEMNKS